MEKSSQPVRTAVQLIAKEAEEAGCSKWDVLKIIKELDEAQDKNMDELRKKTLELLEKINPKAAEIYASFNRLHVYTSAARIETFDRGNIIRSLLRETDITRGVAEKIGSEVEDKVKDLKINYLNTPLIREMTDVKLLEYGHESIHNQYARVGLPVYEVRKKIENEPFANREILAEYNWLQAIPARERELHFSSDLSISAVEDFSTRLFAHSFEPAFSGQSFDACLVELFEQFSATQPFYSLPLNLNALNFLVSAQLPRGRKKQAPMANLLCRALNALYQAFPPSPARPSVGLDLFVRDHLERFSKSEDPALDFANEFIRAYNEGPEAMKFDLVVCLENKYQLKLLDNAFFQNHRINFLNCKNSNLRPFNALRSLDQASIVFDGSLNILKQALLFKESRKSFDSALAGLCRSLSSLAALKADNLKSRVYLHFLENQVTGGGNALDLSGLFDAPRVLREGLSEKECAEDAQAILAGIADALGDAWSLSAQRNEVSTHRFAEYARERLNFVPEHRKTQADFQRFNATAKRRLVLRNVASTRAELEAGLGENTRLLTFTRSPEPAEPPAPEPVPAT